MQMYRAETYVFDIALLHLQSEHSYVNQHHYVDSLVSLIQFLCTEHCQAKWTQCQLLL